MNKRIKWGIGIVVVAALAGGGIFAAKAMSSKDKDKPEVPKLMEFTVNEIATVRNVTLPVELQTTGVLSAERSATVRAKSSAVVNQLFVREGETVKAGQIVAQLDSAELQQRMASQDGTSAAAQARLVAAKKARDQQQALFNQQYISQTALDASQGGYDAAIGDARAAQAQVALARQALGDVVVKSPLAGVVAKRFVQPGEKVSFDAPLIQVVDLSTLELQAWVPPEALGQLRAGSVVKVSVTGMSTPINATVKRVLPVADAATRQIGVVIGIPNGNQQMKAGLQASASIVLESRAGLGVPTSAVADNSGVTSIWVAKPSASSATAGASSPATGATGAADERMVKRMAVTTGLRDDGTGISQISGVDIKEGDVVLAGRYDGLKDGQTVKFISTAIASTPMPKASASAPTSPNAK